MKRFLLIVILLLVPALGAGIYYKAQAPHGFSAGSARVVILTPEHAQHILYGDERGGGHLHGVSKPCKSEFPQDWDAEKITTTAERIAANDNLNWEAQHNGYYVAESNEGDVRVRVVLGPQRQHIITAYPVNVERNPCPANDNN